MLWTDTFTNFFHPEIDRAALDVLKAAGYSVTIPAAMSVRPPLYSTVCSAARNIY